MAANSSEYFSVRITEFLMRSVGFWYAETSREKRLLQCITAYTATALAVAFFIESLDIYFSRDDLHSLTYTACGAMSVLIVLVKVAIFSFRRTELLETLRYTVKHFWNREYDDYSKKILKDIDRKGLTLICLFTFFVGGVIVTYTLAPILENIGKNETDRVLPFKIWLNIPSTTTPYFEFFFVIETLALLHTGICFCCFDNFMTVLCIYTAGQFKILQHKFQDLFHVPEDRKDNRIAKSPEQQYQAFEECIMEHRALIRYVERLEYLFSLTTMFQLLLSSTMLCIAGFQILVAQGSIVRRLIFVVHLSGYFFQIFAITLTINEVTTESGAVGEAIYKSSWASSDHHRFKSLKKASLMVIMRSRKLCCISAGGFFPVTLETFMSVLSTAASYFTLLRKLETDQTENSG